MTSDRENRRRAYDPGEDDDEEEEEDEEWNA